VGIGVNAANFMVTANGGFALPSGASQAVPIPQSPWSGRFWGRLGCEFDPQGQGTCESGDCAGGVGCSGWGKPATLAEMTIGGFMGNEFYNLSLIEGFNVTMRISPTAGTFTPSGDPRWCGGPACTQDVNAACPPELRRGNTCYGACFALGGDDNCCEGAFLPATGRCVPTPHSQFFKGQCPDAYSYPADDATSVYSCQATAYEVTFCP
jgi:hypothetical protein